MQMITDDYMREILKTAKPYTLVLLKAGPHYNDPGRDKITWEHARRNFAMRADGVLSVVCPVGDDTDFKGIYIFNLTPDEAKKLMDDDPGVQVGAYGYEIHPTRGFPGDFVTAQSA